MSYGRDDRGRGGGGGDNSGRGCELQRNQAFLSEMSRSALKADDLYDAFTKFGKIKDIHLPRDYYTGSQRGFGFVEFYDWRDAEDAQYDMDGKNLDGKRLEITFAQSDRRTSNEMRVGILEGQAGTTGVATATATAVTAGAATVNVTVGEGTATVLAPDPVHHRAAVAIPGTLPTHGPRSGKSTADPDLQVKTGPAVRDSREPVRNTRSDSRDRPPNREPQALPPPKSHPEERDEGNKQMNGEEGERFNEGYKSPRRYDATQEMSRSPEVRGILAAPDASPAAQYASPAPQGASPAALFDNLAPQYVSRLPLRVCPAPPYVRLNPPDANPAPLCSAHAPLFSHGTGRFFGSSSELTV
eukprot:CAMPEP_0174341442 /NCGR_PEP_ID=MMETSP0810-20121108/25440_1 /TAXON_ID=73025 ORGANISM="Eutreptiella gymnastica-like, Strain CCMP1594" /NCGR_SAMPLE_ID=MMETSP0810 /ASSEMBLY_ACC=CAM_ASM_000659 /LENGTH=356 /DNA_ID=CAMNT_0015463131 /DNA_START=13 /DNA_END=1084 /DNA_ORIENTATION=-